jgi:hypothetical protein
VSAKAIATRMTELLASDPMNEDEQTEYLDLSEQLVAIAMESE